jgi:GPH family glycoside/pentoside/hexuronide:cation symporter
VTAPKAAATTLPFPVLAAYAAPAVPLALLGIPLTVHLPAFWAGEMGLSLAAVGAVLTLARLFDAVADPLVGRWSDLAGRRKPFIAAGLPVAALGIAGLFFPPEGAGAAWLLGFSMLVALGWTLLSLPYQAWGAGLSADYGERARITGWREGGTILGIVLSAALPAVLGISGAAATLAMLAALTMGLAVPLVGWMLARVPEPPVRDVPAHAGLAAALRMAAANAPFRRLLLAWLVNGIANGLPAALFLLLCLHVLQAPEAAGPLLLLYFLAGIAGLPLWTWLARRVGKHVAWCLAMAWACAAFAFVPVLGPGTVLVFAAICVASGLGLGADLSLPPAIQADVVEMDALASGEDRAGLFFAAWTMAQKAGQALAVGIAFPLLELAGFRAEGENTAFALWALVALYCLVPIALKLGAVALMWGFPLTAGRLGELRARMPAPPPRAPESL